MSNNAKSHIAIVGAGLGGLAAAIGIAKAGHQVTIVEQAPALGEVSFAVQAQSFCYPIDIQVGWFWHPDTSERVSNFQAMGYTRRNRAVLCEAGRHHHPSLS